MIKIELSELSAERGFRFGCIAHTCHIVGSVASQAIEFDLRRGHRQRIEHLDARQLFVSVQHEWIARAAVHLINKKTDAYYNYNSAARNKIVVLASLHSDICLCTVERRS